MSEEEGRGGGKKKKKGDVRVPRYQEHEITHVSVECLQEFLYFPFALNLSLQKTPAYISLSCLLPPVLSHLSPPAERERGWGRKTS
jgi:hypothetical protein